MSTSPSPRSASPSPPSTSSRDRNGKLDHLPRSRALKRPCRWETVGDAHLRYLWRAYRRGELETFPLEPDMEPAQFQAAIVGLVTPFQGDLLVFINHAEEPVGLTIVSYQTLYERRRAFPHAIWFREATPRQRLECSLRFLLNLKKSSLVVIEAKQPYWPFFEHLCKYGVLRRVGTIRDAYGAGGRTAIYQGVGK